MLQLSFVKFKKDSYILIEGKSNTECFYIIQNGQVKIEKESEVVAEEEGNILGSGDFLGVVACMSKHNHIETAIALTEVTLISVKLEQFPDLIAKNTPVAMKIIYSFSRKMRYLDEALTRITLKKNVSTDISHLFTIGEYYMRMSKFQLAVYAFYHYLKSCPNGENAIEARKRIGAIQAMGVKLSAEMLEPKTDSMVRVYQGESTIFCECQSGAELYIIQKGNVKITKIVDNNEVLLAILKEGDMFGEMALLENKPRSASAIVGEGGCQLLAVNHKNFNYMVSTQPQLVASLTTTFAERLWSMYRQLANTMIKKPVEKMFDMLALQFEKNKVPPMEKKPYEFEFGPIELANMCGIPKDAVSAAVSDFLADPVVRSTGNNISVTDQLEIVKKADYYKKMQRINESRKAARENSGAYW